MCINVYQCMHKEYQCVSMYVQRVSMCMHKEYQCVSMYVQRVSMCMHNEYQCVSMYVQRISFCIDVVSNILNKSQESLLYKYIYIVNFLLFVFG